MQHKSLLSRLTSLLSRRQLKERLAHVAMALSCLAVFLVTYMLVAPVLTQEWPAVCGLEEHTHTDECYTVELVEVPGQEQEVTERVLTCPYEEGEDAHTHDDSCYTTETVLVCGLEENEEHTHSESCYETKTTLTCPLEESEGHIHTESCYRTFTQTVPGEPKYEEVKVLTCGKEEHVHTDACYTPPEESGPEYICGYDIEHTHDDSCYFDDGTLKCTIPEHTHTDACLAASDDPQPDDEPEPTEEPQPTEEPDEPDGSIFPAEIPEDYVEAEVFQPEAAVYAIAGDEAELPSGPDALVYVHRDAFQTPVLFVPQPVYDEDVLQTLTDALTEAEVDFDGMTALDLAFLDEEGEEQEPLIGPVYVKLTLPQALPEEAQPQLHHMTEDGLEPVEADVDYDPDTETLTLGFAVDSFSGFTVTWTNGSSYTLNLVYVDSNLKSIGQDVTGTLSGITNNGWLMVNRKTEIEAGVPDGYQFDHLEIKGIGQVNDARHYYSWLWGSNEWRYKDSSDKENTWSVTGTPTVYVVCKAVITVDLTIEYGYYDSNKVWTHLDTNGTEPVTAGTTLTLSDLTLSTFKNYTLDHFEDTTGKRVETVTCDADGNLTPATVWAVYTYNDPNAPTFDTTENKNAVKVFLNKTILELDGNGNYMGDIDFDKAAWTNAIDPQFNGTYYTYVSGKYVEEDSAVGSRYRPLGYRELVKGGDGGSNNAYFLVGGSKPDEANSQDNNTYIRNMEIGKGGFTPTTEEGAPTYYMQTFPTDEAVLAYLRSHYDVTQNQIADPDDPKKVVPAEDLTPDKYTVRWYSMKYNVGDYWHLDGVLVKKLGRLRVTKTFYGDPTAIATVTDPNHGFYITVTSDTDAEKVFTLKLTDKDVLKETDADGQIVYTWYLDNVEVGATYKVVEHEYTYSQRNITTLTEYRFSGDGIPDTDETPHSWTHYVHNPGLPITGLGYDADAHVDFQTVHFRSSFLPMNSITLNSLVDDGSALPGVSYRIYKDGKAVPLYLLDGVYYLYRPQGEDVDPTQVQQVSAAAADSSGRIVIGGVGQDMGAGTAGTYQVRETARPDGYSESWAQFTIDNDGTVDWGTADQAASHEKVKFQDLSQTEGSGTGTKILVYRMDLPHTVDHMKVTGSKAWSEDLTPADSVLLALYRDNAYTGVTVTLNATNHWTGTFKNPDRDDGLWPTHTPEGRVTCTVREVVGGQTYYPGRDPTPGDRYIVTFAQKDTTERRTEDFTGNTRTVLTGVDFTVTNADSGKIGSFFFYKTNEDGNTRLPGAVFGLYTDADCTQKIATLTSDEEGKVTSPTLPVGTYYLKETMAPETYKLSDVVYEVAVSQEVDSTPAFTISAVHNGVGDGERLLQKDARDGGVYLIKNETAFTTELPATGGSGTTLWYTMGLAMILAAAFLLYKVKKREGGSVW